MTSRDFCYWLQGYIEIEKERAGAIGMLGEGQVQCIAKHLALVFVHEIDPSAGPPEHQAKLNEIHEKKASAPWNTPGDGSGVLVRC
jgi:hypothetical protein